MYFKEALVKVEFRGSARARNIFDRATT